jgi:hemolysin activation/secretion protein
MRYCILILLLFIPLPASAQNVPAPQVVSQAQGALISNIKIEGFVLQDKNQFVKLFKPYCNKHLSAADIDTILQQLQEIYEQAGYQRLVSIEYHVKRKTLTFTVALIK